MSFIEQMKSLSIEEDTKLKKEKEIKEKAIKDKEEKRKEDVKHELMIKLTRKYHGSIKRGIENASKQGKREKYINFDRNEFKANCKGLGFPQEIEKMWLEEMCNPESPYLPSDENEVKIHFQGISYNIWNNTSFTTHFKW